MIIAKVIEGDKEEKEKEQQQEKGERQCSWYMLLLWAEGPNPEFAGRPQQGVELQEVT